MIRKVRGWGTTRRKKIFFEAALCRAKYDSPPLVTSLYPPCIKLTEITCKCPVNWSIRVKVITFSTTLMCYNQLVFDTQCCAYFVRNFFRDNFLHYSPTKRFLPLNGGARVGETPPQTGVAEEASGQWKENLGVYSCWQKFPFSFPVFWRLLEISPANLWSEGTAFQFRRSDLRVLTLAVWLMSNPLRPDSLHCFAVSSEKYYSWPTESAEKGGNTVHQKIEHSWMATDQLFPLKDIEILAVFFFCK